MTNKLVLGTANFGLDYGIKNGKQLGYEEVEKILLKAFDLGMRTLDTAVAYGNAHKVIGEFHRRNPSIRFSVITKLNYLPSDSLTIETEKLLEELHIGELEGVMLHNFGLYKELKSQQKADELIRLGEHAGVRSIGVSLYENDELFEVAEDGFMKFVQGPFNLLDNESLRGDAYRNAHLKNLEIHCRSPFLQGLFFLPDTSKQKAYEDLRSQIMELNGIRIEAEITMHELALSYVYSKSYVDKIVVGVDSVEQLISNYSSQFVLAGTQVLDKIDKIVVENKKFLNPSTWNK